jgi:putative PIN family toxin of toxin-antitoxin system
LITATFDTNVYIRALHFGGRASLLIGHARAGNIRVDISDAILDETNRVLRDKFQWSSYMLHDARLRLLGLANHVTPAEVLSVIREDPDDDRILECATAANSEYIVSEDKDLLRLGKYRSTRIVNVELILEILAQH